MNRKIIYPVLVFVFLYAGHALSQPLKYFQTGPSYEYQLALLKLAMNNNVNPY